MTYPHFDPVIFKIGPLAIRWYGLMYLAGFLFASFWISRLAKGRGLNLSKENLSDLVFYAVLGVILGGRLGYVIFYNGAYFLEHPLKIFAVWEGGMSFHGGLLGVVTAMLIFCRKQKLPVLNLGDVVVAAAPIGLGLGRIGNFINGELWGRTTDVPWGMVFPYAGDLPRHPSQLYEMLLEGVLLFFILWLLHRLKTPIGVPFFSFFLLYGVFRFGVEFVREPDVQLGYLWGGATMGQILSLPMILFGLVGLLWVHRREHR
ncbi:prolipoprotein diacylglyceryl transferase [Geopsychrobacter electrodiphilus]|uniref:prolipoprotein diacylglyceryl transferase n=1 Tax=Geopsychrobacter electrodiphilus TaxID=225196 RepID=UPI0004769D24